MSGTELWAVVTLLLTIAMFGSLIGLAVATAKFSDKQLIQFLQQSLPSLGKMYPPLTIVSLAAAIILNYLYRSSGSPFWFSLANTFGILAFFLITTKGNVPINKQLEKWQLNALPNNWESTISRWKKFNVTRSVLGIIGMVCLVIAAVKY